MKANEYLAYQPGKMCRRGEGPMRRLQWAALVLVFSIVIGGATTALEAGGGPPASMSLSSATIQGLGSATLDLTMGISQTGAQGYVACIGYDGSLVEVTDLSVGAAAASVGAELVSPEIFADGATLGVVLDAEAPFDGQMIPPGGGHEVGLMTVNATGIVTTDTDVAFDFVDGVLNNPALSNIVVIGGLSIGAADGLETNNGTVTLTPPPPDNLTIESASAPSDGGGVARVLMSNSSGDVQGYVTAVAHDATALTLTGVNISGTVAEAAGAEFVVPMMFADGGTMGVVLDFDPPYDGQVIGLGDDQHIANYAYSCNNEILLPDPSVDSALTFSDGTFGSPLLYNVIVVGGVSLSPSLTDGTFTCEAIEPPPPEDTIMSIDADPPCVVPGGSGTLSFSYQDEDDNIQGFTIAACYDCDLNLVQGSFDIAGSIVEAVGAEFVSHQVDNDCSDGETGELIIGILCDAAPPFDGQTLPTTAVPLLVGSIDYTVDAGAACDSHLAVDFCNGINGNGNVALNNNVVINWSSVQNYTMNGTSVCVSPEEIFQRGDCNSDDKTDLADAAATLASQFLGYSISCADACDANDDGLVNMADSVFTLSWLFMFGPEQPAPGPYNDGPDPTSDTLPDCDSDDTAC